LFGSECCDQLSQLIKDFICSPELSALALGLSGLVPLFLETLYSRCLQLYHFRSNFAPTFHPGVSSAEGSSLLAITILQINK
jgi:hypothetical protein